MSTKIYNGFKLKSIKSLDKAFFFVKEMRPQIKEAVELQFSKQVAERSCLVYDEAMLFDKELGHSAMAHTLKEIDDELFESRKSRRKSYYDFGVELSLAVTSDKSVIGIIFCESNEVRNTFFGLKGVVKYPYWDSTDKPEDVSIQEWSRRRGHWNEVLSIGIPAHEMFSIRLFDEYTMIVPNKDEISKQIITFERRLQKIAERSTIEKVYAEKSLESPRDIIRFLMNSPEFPARVEAEKEELKKKLKPTLTIEDLIEKI